MRRILLVLATCVAAVGGALGLPLTASAHALAQSSDPLDGAILQQAPQFVTITFGEDPDPKLSSIQILDASGQNYDRGSTLQVSDDPKKLRVGMRAAPNGVYTVTWRTVSAVDGHLASGAFAFGVGVSAVPPPQQREHVPPSPAPSPLAVAGRWLLYVGVATVLGAGFIGLVAYAEPPASSMRLTTAGAAILLVGTAAVSEAQRLDAGIGYSQLLTTSLGRNLISRIVPMAVVLAAALLAVWFKGRTRGWCLACAGLGSAGALLADVIASHAAAGALPLANGLVQWVHGLAAGIWIGGLLALLLSVRGAESQIKARAVRRFSTAAAVALITVAVTGVIRAVVEIGSWDKVLTTTFGLLVVVKVGLILVLAGLGAINRLRNVPVAAQRLGGLRRVGSTEVVVGAAALLTAAGLVNVAPPAYASAAPAPAQVSVVATGADYATTVKVRLEINPGTAGFNRFTLQLTDFDTGKPIAADKVVLQFSLPSRDDIGGSSLDLTRIKDGTYQGTGTNLSLDGNWRINVFIQRAPASTQVTLTLATRVTPQKIDVQRVAGLPTLYTIHLTQGRTLQVYLDPGKPGRNQFHTTFFDSAGNELPFDQATISMTPQGGRPGQLVIRELEPGHFVADASVAKGIYRFDIVGTTRSGEQLVSHLDITVGS